MGFAEYLIIVIAGFMVLMTLYGVRLNKQEKENRKKKIQAFHNGPSGRKLDEKQFEKIKGYFQAHPQADSLDEITWNDLNMNHMFELCDYAFSVPGEALLYDILRKPMVGSLQLEKRESQIAGLQKDSELRIQMQNTFWNIGYMGKYSLYRYLQTLDQAAVFSTVGMWIENIAVFAALGLMFVSVPAGLLLFLVVLCYKLIRYFKRKSEAAPYLASFSYVLRLLKAADILLQMASKDTDHGIEVLFPEEVCALRNSVSELQSFRKGTFWLMHGAGGNAAANPMDLLLEYGRMLFSIDLIKYSQMLEQLKQHQDDVDCIYRNLGIMEAMICIAEYRAYLGEQYTIPIFSDENKSICIKELYHPYLEHPVKNSICAGKGVLLTGSNATGKSTFLKAVAINMVLAQTIHTALAASYESAIYQIYSSLSLSDDLENGDSYYMAEIKAMKRILDAGKENPRVVCFVDEILKGTNTVERIAASCEILEVLRKDGMMCFAATHDRELTQLLVEDYDNYHFEEIMQGDVMKFSYQLKEGPAMSRNAIKLLQTLGYDETLTRQAEQRAITFLEQGIWQI